MEMDSTPAAFSYGGGDDNLSMGANSSIGMASAAKAGEGQPFTAEQFGDGHPNANPGGAGGGEVEDALTLEAQNAVTKERQMLHKENAAKLQSILENIKNATKSILKEMDSYLEETEEVEKAYIRCRANTQKESQRMEQVEPDVIAATQRFVAQGAQLFGGAGGAMSFMNVAAAMGGGGGGGGATGAAPAMTAGAGTGDPMMGTVTPRPHDGSSMAGSSMAGSMN
ncbi:hypothetical protein ACHAXT_008851 [Thalassiosira profunda]